MRLVRDEERRARLAVRHAMLARVRAVHAGVRAGEVELLVLAAQWADAHPDLDPVARLDPAWVDETIAPLAHKVGSVTLERLLDESMLRLYPEERELDQLEALDARYATLDASSIGHTGVAEMTLRGDWKDLADFDATLSQVAAALAVLDETAHRPAESLDVRRSRAVGILADPEQAAALLADPAAAVAGLDPVGRCEATSRAVLEQQVRQWCGRTDIHLSVSPVIDLNDHHAVDAYEVSDRLRARTGLLHTMCVFL